VRGAAAPAPALQTDDRGWDREAADGCRATTARPRAARRSKPGSGSPSGAGAVGHLSGTVVELLETRWRRQPWFEFYWDTLGPMSWYSTLSLIRLGGRRSLVCLIHEQQPVYLLGIVEPDDDPLLMSRVFTRSSSETVPASGFTSSGASQLRRPTACPKSFPSPSLGRAAGNGWSGPRRRRAPPG
jgi:hypothetical protein